MFNCPQVAWTPPRQQGGTQVASSIRYKMEFYMRTVANTVCQNFLQSCLKLGGSDCTSCHAARSVCAEIPGAFCRSAQEIWKRTLISEKEVVMHAHMIGR